MTEDGKTEVAAADGTVLNSYDGNVQLIARWAESVTLSLEPGDDAACDTENRLYKAGAALGELPVPRRTDGGNDIFLGWYNGETKYTETSTIQSDLTLTARWTPAVTVTFTWDVTQANGSVTHNEQTVALSSLVPMTEPGYEGCYKLPVKVSAKEMTDTITATLTVGGQTYTNEYTVKDYAETILADTTHQIYSEELWNLADAMLVYGAAAQRQFNYNTGNPASDGTPAALTDGEIADLHENQIGALPDGITFAGSSLLLKAETTYRLYFSVANGKTLTVTRDGEALTATKKGSYWYVEITDIAAKNILDDVTLVVNGVECTFNAGNYIKSVLTDPTADPTLVTTVTALYRYCKAAQAYFDTVNQQP